MAGRVFFRFMTLCGGLIWLAGCATVTPQTTSLTAAPNVTPQGLLGSTPQVLSAEFGTPVLRRVDGPAQVWLYHSAICGLNVFLYPDANGTPRVAAAVPDNDDASACMQSLTHGLTSAALEPPPSS